jgi:hypothetical protein
MFVVCRKLFKLLVSFGRACAPVRCAHPSFWSHYHAQRGAARPPAYRSFAALIYPPKLFHRSELGRQGRISFHWAKLHPTELLHPNELHCTLLRYAVSLRYAAFNWVTLHPIWAKLRPKSYAAICELSWALLSCTLMSYAAPYWALPHPKNIYIMFPKYPSFADPYNKIMLFRENPAKIPLWQKIRQRIPLLL